MADKEDDIEGYHNESLSNKERHQIEKKALSDSFLSDAIEGSETISAENFAADLQEISGKIKRPDSLWFTPLRIAASILILVSAGSLFFYLNSEEPVTLAMEKSANISSDSVTASKIDSSSTSTLLTLAKPEETEKRKEQSGPSATKKEINTEKTDALTQPTPTTGSAANGEAMALDETKSEEKKLTDEEPIVEEREVVTKSQEAPAVSLSQFDSKKDLASAKKESKVRAARSSYASDDAKVSQQITGNVVAAEDGIAMPGVNVLIKGSNIGTVTDSNGNFEINTTATDPQLVISFIGMNTIEVKPEGQKPVNIKMKEDASQLSEVVVTAFGLQEEDKSREPVIKSAAPIGGLKAYNRYLEKNLRYPVQALEQNLKGKVLIEFTVETNGDLSDFSVIKGLCKDCDEEVIRLVKEGPTWAPSTRDDVAVEAQVKVRMKFDPAKAQQQKR